MLVEFAMVGMDSAARLTYPKATPSKKYAVHTQRVAGHINGVLDVTSDASLINARPAEDGDGPGDCIRMHEKLSSLASFDISPTSMVLLCYLFCHYIGTYSLSVFYSIILRCHRKLGHHEAHIEHLFVESQHSIKRFAWPR